MLNPQMQAILQAIQQPQYQQNFPPVVGRAPPQPPFQMPTAGNHMFQPQGPYGAQAMNLAGLLGNPGMGGMGGISGPGNIQTQQGLLGGPPKGFRVPFYRPTGK
jgi:hypothetical protein